MWRRVAIGSRTLTPGTEILLENVGSGAAAGVFRSDAPGATHQNPDATPLWRSRRGGAGAGMPRPQAVIIVDWMRGWQRSYRRRVFCGSAH
jgi:hypothetical protein